MSRAPGTIRSQKPRLRVAVLALLLLATVLMAAQGALTGGHP
jgi:hypothetical protein